MSCAYQLSDDLDVVAVLHLGDVIDDVEVVVDRSPAVLDVLHPAERVVEHDLALVASIRALRPLPGLRLVGGRGWGLRLLCLALAAFRVEVVALLRAYRWFAAIRSNMMRYFL